jgi:predicted permease
MQIFLLCLILVGFMTAKVRIVDERARSSLSDLILDIFLPCNILSSFLGTSTSQLPSLGVILLISTVNLLFCFLFARLLYRKVGREQKKVLLYATIISNASFLGNPVVESLFGIEALIYSAIYLVPLRVALWTVGIAIFSSEKVSWKKAVFHPCLVAIYVGILVMITGFTPPSLVSRLVFSLGNCTTPISMLVVGNVLGMAESRKLINKLTFYYAFIRLVLLPCILMGVMFVLRPAPIISGVSVILSGMPAPATTSILANKFGGDKELASKIIFASTVLSMVTIPVLIWLLQHF